ncbi:HTH-type transcriptional regulator DegA [bioreactor metagenome]|uniref:HTH-type transcriptional regulator DegA n=1 Tax=bioreactor metagenome TaxID=1076179 RepID=A0A645CP95_9ZZZZ
MLASNIHGNMIDDQPASRANFFVGLIETELIRHGIQVELDTFDHLRGSDFKTYVNRLKSAHIRGVICIYGLQEMEELNRKLADSGFYVLDIRNEQSSNATINTIWYDNYLVGRIAAGFLVENSHRNICCIASDLGLEWEKERISAFEDMIRAADGEIRGSVLRLPSPSAEGKRECWEAIGRNAVDRLLQIGNISAAFCVNDGIAAGLCRELQRRKLNVPGDISVIGCDNDYTYWDLGLSTVSLECLRLGTVAADIMNKCLRGERDSVLTSAIKIPPLLIPRKTVRKLGS